MPERSICDFISHDHKLPGDLESNLRNGGGVLLGARCSGDSGVKARTAVMQDAEEMLNALAATGLDLRDALPPRETLDHLLTSVEREKSYSPEGKPFFNSFVTLELAERCVLLMSNGTAKELDDTYTQPFVDRLQQLMMEHSPALLFARRLDRLTRNATAFARLLGVAERLSSDRIMWVGDAKRGIQELNKITTLTFFIEGFLAEGTAETLPLQSRTGMSARTDRRMSNGRVRYAAPAQTPPGSTRGRLKDGTAMVVLDTPTCTFEAAEVASLGLVSHVVNGNKICQVENVRFALSNFGRPGWTALRIAQELLRRGYMTDKRRGKPQPTPDELTPKQAQNLLQSILDRLDVYETGVLPVNLGTAGVDDFAIEGFMPLDGPWLSPEDSRRIHSVIGGREKKRQSFKGRTFAGLPVTSESGDRCQLRASDEGEPHGSTRYRVVDGRTGTKYPGQMVLTHDMLTEAIEEGLSRAVAQGLRLDRVLGKDYHDELHAHEVAVNRLTTQRAALVTEKESLGNLLRNLSDAQASADDPSFRDAMQDYNNVSTAVDSVEQQLAESQKRCEALRATEPMAEGVSIEHLADLMRSLSNPFDTTHKTLLRSMLDLTVSVSRTTRRRHTTKHMRLTGSLLVNDGTKTFAIPVEVTRDFGGEEGERRRAEQFAAQMRQGVPLAAQKPNPFRTALPSIAKIFGYSTDYFPLARCEDRRLLRITLALIDNARAERPTSLVELANELNEPLALLRRLEKLHVRPTHRHWLITRFNRTHRDARCGDCPHCGHATKLLSRLREVDGWICEHCRRDAEGVLWPVEPYGRWDTTEGLSGCSGV